MNVIIARSWLLSRWGEIVPVAEENRRETYVKNKEYMSYEDFQEAAFTNHFFLFRHYTQEKT